jgi:hypothetical protein
MKMTFLISLLAAIGVSFVATEAKADPYNQNLSITFTVPVEVPGRVLEPGTYVFKMASGTTDTFRDVVEIYNENETHLEGLFLTRPDYRLAPAWNPIIMFEERAAGVPEAIHAWYYPGDNYGHRFVYRER